MMLVMLLGTLLSRQADSLNSLGIALVILCFVNPYCVMSLGLRLSFLSTLGIIVGYGNIDFPLNPYIARVKINMQSASVSLFSAPSEAPCSPVRSLCLL